jgi:hypothetical protein
MRNESGRQITAFGAELELLSYSIHILIKNSPVRDEMFIEKCVHKNIAP